MTNFRIQAAYLMAIALNSIGSHGTHKKNVETPLIYCSTCYHYNEGKRFCKIANHAIKATTPANKCGHYKLKRF